MSRRLTWDRRALADLRAISDRDERLAQRIFAAIEQYADNNQGDARKLAGRTNLHRLRVGDWRVLFRLEEGGQQMAVSRILNRRDAYR